MAKRLFLIIIAGLIGIINSPTFLAATDRVAVTGLDQNGIVETVLPEPETIDVSSEPISSGSFGDIAASNSASENALAQSTIVQEVPVAPANAISVGGRVIGIVEVGNTAVDSGDHVNKFGDKFLYGHNSTEVFGNLVCVGVGNVFTVAYGGASTNYQVVERVIYEKVSDTVLRADGADYKMRAIVNGKNKYDMVLMTCYGTSYGNGDASHRLVLYANRI